MSERIQKLLATAGIASRRAVEEWIALGRITVNGRPAEVGQKIAHDDHVRVDGRLVALARKPAAPRVLLFRKKTGELVTRDDPEGRRTVFRKLPELETGRWIAVGRLDINTSGLLLMTNDGELARRLTHPSFEIKRVYAVRVLGELTDDIRRRLLSGVQLDDGPARYEKLVDVDPPDLEVGEPGGANRWYEVTMGEGRNRIVRRLFEAEGLQVSRLIRIAYGPVVLGRGIKAGSYREATAEELNALLQAVRMSPLPAPARGAKRSVPRRSRGEIDDDVEVRQVPAGKRATAGSVRGNASEPSRARPAGMRTEARDEPRKPAPARDARPQSAGRSKHRTASAGGSVGAALKSGRAASRRAHPVAEEPVPPPRFERADRAARRAPESSRPASSAPGGGRRESRAGGGHAKGRGRAPSVKGDSMGSSQRQGGADSRAAAKSGPRSPSEPGGRPGGRPGGKPGAARRPPKKPGR